MYSVIPSFSLGPRVVVVDSSDEIAGGGKLKTMGRARIMPVIDKNYQYDII